MKRFFTPIMSLALVALTAFNWQGGIDEVIGALRAGSAAEVAKYLDDNVELTVPDKSDNYSKAQAQLIIKDFFSNNAVKGFELKHKGDSRDGHYAIGTLQTNSGNFRTNVFTKVKNGREVIREIRFQSVD
jgi:hypothetical protein